MENNTDIVSSTFGLVLNMYCTTKKIKIPIDYNITSIDELLLSWIKKYSYNRFIYNFLMYFDKLKKSKIDYINKFSDLYKFIELDLCYNTHNNVDKFHHQCANSLKHSNLRKNIYELYDNWGNILGKYIYVHCNCLAIVGEYQDAMLNLFDEYIIFIKYNFKNI